MAKQEKKASTKAVICVLDEPGWLSLPETYKLLLSKAGTTTAFELSTKLKSGKLPYVHRSATNPSQYEPEPASFWQDREFDADYLHYFGELYIYSIDPVTGRRDPGTRLDGEEFYVRQEDCVKVWPALQATKESEVEEPSGGKPGRKAEWQYFVAGKFCTLKHKGKPPTTGDLALLCQEEFGYPVDESGIRKLIRELRRLLGD
jgi:hypothetical protein